MDCILTIKNSNISEIKAKTLLNQYALLKMIL